LTPFLQGEFERLCPAGWQCSREVDLIPPALALSLGYMARADILLVQPESTRRIWVEFEVRRADPVSNHAKFATSHLFDPRPPTDSFVSMVSPHVTRGRRNLAANTIRLMRIVGMRAYQTCLLPLLPPDQIQRLNQTPVAELTRAGLSIGLELERIMAVVDPAGSWDSGEVHLVADLSEVMANLRQWNSDIAPAEGGKGWGKRGGTFFVYDPVTALFAPSKFCAYILLPDGTTGGGTSPAARGGRWDVATYCAINDGTHIMDGHRARVHLADRLGMLLRSPADNPEVATRFAAWLADHANAVRVDTGGPQFLVPPTWCAG
ncbi:MAG: hypothetical protein C0501_24270, partial [Isosphaera sp.]|nr:hypothetical protein [Isosphaera sp.]